MNLLHDLALPSFCLAASMGTSSVPLPTPVLEPRGGVERVRFLLANRQVHVPVYLAGDGPHWFILDTGSSGGCIEASVAEHLGLETVGTVSVGDGSGNGNSELSEVRARDVKLSGTSIGDLELVSGPFARSMPGGEQRVGILGLDAFREICFAIDYPEGIVELSREPGTRLPNHHSFKLTLPDESGTELSAELRVGAETQRVVLDTGSSSVVNLPYAFIERVPTAGEPRKSGEARSFGNRYDIFEVVLRDPIELAGHRFADATVTLNRHHAVGIVGYELLKEFRLSVDLARRLVWLERPPEAEPRGGEPSER